MRVHEYREPAPHRLPDGPAALQPCQRCGAWQWLLGLTSYVCAACGFQVRGSTTERNMS